MSAIPSLSLIGGHSPCPFAGVSSQHPLDPPAAPRYGPESLRGTPSTGATPRGRTPHFQSESPFSCGQRTLLLVTGTRSAGGLTLGFFLSVQRSCLPVTDAAGQRCVWRRLTHEPLPRPGGNWGSSRGGLRGGAPPGRPRMSQGRRCRTRPRGGSEGLARGPSGQYLISIPGHPHTRPPQPGRSGQGELGRRGREPPPPACVLPPRGGGDKAARQKLPGT